MKRYIIIFLLVAFAWNAQAQTPDTVPLDQPIRGYYYWDNNWAGEFYDSRTVAIYWGEWIRCIPHIQLRYCYTREPLEIIGIAGCYQSDPFCFCCPPEDRLPEYFQIYTYKGGFHLEAEALWDTASVKHYMQVEYREFHEDGTFTAIDGYDTYCPVYECYFEKPVSVIDSFYVGVTKNNNYKDPATHNFAHCISRDYFIHAVGPDMFGPQIYGDSSTSIVKYRYTCLDTNVVYVPHSDVAVESLDTNWHWQRYPSAGEHMMFFPIFKTDDVEVPQTVLEEYVMMRPNPATDRVQVFSSFNIRSIEVHNIAGQLVERRKVDATQTVLDVSSWEKGPYVVTITTPAGTVTRKLVVQ